MTAGKIPFEAVAEIVATHPKRYAPVVADRFGVPVATAHRWVYEGRRRGLVPPVADMPCQHCGGTGATRYGPKMGVSGGRGDDR